MAVKKKNLSKDNIDDVNDFQFSEKPASSTMMNLKISDIPIKVKCLTERQKELKKAIEDFEIVIGEGPAGVGKTHMSLLMALHLLKTEPLKYQKLVLVKSVQVIKGEEVGFLKGNLDDKLSGHMISFTSNLDKIFGSKAITKHFIDSGLIEIVPIAYIRGCTYDRAIMLVDEIQNITLSTFKTIVTRIGEDSKFIFLGDSEQIDLTNKKESCLKKVVELFKDTDFIKVLSFVDSDCVRNPIIPKILEILDKKE